MTTYELRRVAERYGVTETEVRQAEHDAVRAPLVPLGSIGSALVTNLRAKEGNAMQSIDAPHSSIASDYAVLHVPSKGITLYFGYESAPADDRSNWCFEYRSSHGTIIAYSYHALGMKKPWDVTDGLLRGIGKLIDDGYLTFDERTSR